MLLTVKDLIKFLRSSVNVQTTDEGSILDPAYLVMTDEDLELFIKIAVSRAFPNVSSLEELPSGSEYPIVLLAKIELYMKLAVTEAYSVNISADGASLSRDQRFQHYMKLAEEARAEYENWIDNEGQGVVTSYDLMLSSRHYSHRNYEKQVTPKVFIGLDTVTTDTISFHWSLENSSHFGRYKVYISESPIVDIYVNSGSYESKITEGAKLILSTSDIRQKYHKISGLSANTSYHIAVLAIERNQVFGFYETTITTLPLLEDEEDFSTETLLGSD